MRSMEIYCCEISHNIIFKTVKELNYKTYILKKEKNQYGRKFYSLKLITEYI